jgi:hypothetical protein
MMFPGEETRGLSNAIVGARLMCVNPKKALPTVLHVGYEGGKMAAHS